MPSAGSSESPKSFQTATAHRRGRGLGESAGHTVGVGPRPRVAHSLNGVTRRTTPMAQERGRKGKGSETPRSPAGTPRRDPEMPQRPPAHPPDPHSLEDIFRVVHGEKTLPVTVSPAPKTKSRRRFESPAQPQSPGRAFTRNLAIGHGCRRTGQSPGSLPGDQVPPPPRAAAPPPPLARI